MKNTQKEMPDIVPIVLHRVGSGLCGDFDTITAQSLALIVERIQGKVARLDDLLSPKTERGRRWLMTFDDGNSSDFEIVFPAMHEKGLTAIFFVIVERIGMPGYVSWSQLEEMSRYEFEIGSHSMTHRKLTGIDRPSALMELSESKSIIEDKLGKQARSFSFPFGYYNNDLVKAAQDTGYQFCFNSDHGIVRAPTRVVPRNSINASMSPISVARNLDPTNVHRLMWTIEDSLKARTKTLLGDANYRRWRDIFSGDF